MYLVRVAAVEPLDATTATWLAVAAAADWAAVDSVKDLTATAEGLAALAGLVAGWAAAMVKTV